MTAPTPGTEETPGAITDKDGNVLVDEQGRLVGPDESSRFGRPSTWGEIH